MLIAYDTLHVVKIVLPDKAKGRRLGATVDLHQPPGVIRPEQVKGLAHPVSLDWDQAVNDELHLRRCPVCGCRDLYARKRMPQITVLLAIVFAAIVAMVLFGFGLLWWALGVFLIVLMLDVGIYLSSRSILVCYRCQSQFHGKVVPADQARWDPDMAEGYADHQIDPIQRAFEQSHARAKGGQHTEAQALKVQRGL